MIESGHPFLVSDKGKTFNITIKYDFYCTLVKSLCSLNFLSFLSCIGIECCQMLFRNVVKFYMIFLFYYGTMVNYIIDFKC